MPRTLFGKSRPQDKPYAVYTAPGWEWRVLKTYKHHDAEHDDPYARWFVAASGPGTFGSFELGDTYARDVKTYGRLVKADPEWLEAYAEHATG